MVLDAVAAVETSDASFADDRAPRRRRDEYWKDQYEDGHVLEFRPKATIVLVSRHTRASHLKSYSLAKAIATRVGGIIFDPQMSTTYSARGKPLTKTKEDKESLCYGTPIETYIEVMDKLFRGLQQGNDRKATKKSSRRRQARLRT
jgi:hypothetical protein